MIQKMNKQVQFIAGKEALIIKTMSIGNYDDMILGRYVCVPLTSDDFDKLRYIIEEAIDGVVVLKNRVIIEMSNALMAISFLMPNGKAVSWNKIIDREDTLQLSLLLNYGVYGEKVSKYE